MTATPPVDQVISFPTITLRSMGAQQISSTTPIKRGGTVVDLSAYTLTILQRVNSGANLAFAGDQFTNLAVTGSSTGLLTITDNGQAYTEARANNNSFSVLGTASGDTGYAVLATGTIQVGTV
jgi:hypothetical protein